MCAFALACAFELHNEEKILPIIHGSLGCSLVYKQKIFSLGPLLRRDVQLDSVNIQLKWAARELKEFMVVLAAEI